MSDEKPDPLSDVIRGLGLILRAAKTTVERVPTKGLEEVVLDTAREVGRAIENVANVVEREVRGRKDGPADRPRSGGDTPPRSDTSDRPDRGDPPKPPPDAA